MQEIRYSMSVCSGRVDTQSPDCSLPSHCHLKNLKRPEAVLCRSFEFSFELRLGQRGQLCRWVSVADISSSSGSPICPTAAGPDFGGVILRRQQASVSSQPGRLRDVSVLEPGWDMGGSLGPPTPFNLPGGVL